MVKFLNDLDLRIINEKLCCSEYSSKCDLPDGRVHERMDITGQRVKTNQKICND